MVTEKLASSRKTTDAQTTFMFIDMKSLYLQSVFMCSYPFKSFLLVKMMMIHQRFEETQMWVT